ncbi:hypothetical protein ACWCOW_36360, partial [Streptomyces sp. NPDC001939]
MTIPPVVPHRIDPAGGCPHAANARLLERGDGAGVREGGGGALDDTGLAAAQGVLFAAGRA